jgi:hypothetical protein
MLTEIEYLDKAVSPNYCSTFLAILLQYQVLMALFIKKIDVLTENIFAAVHCTHPLGLPSKVTVSNVRQGLWQIAC